MIKIKKRWEIPESDVTPEALYRQRRDFIKAAGTIGGAMLLNPWSAVQASYPVSDYRKGVITLDEEITDEEDATGYNNEFTEQQPQTSWNMANPDEYGFYSNVNPGVDHPRWSQKRERRIGDIFKRETMMLNGYGEEVAELYDDLDMSVNF